MGLALAIGELAKAITESNADAERALRKDLATINRALRRNSLPEHREPETLPPLPNRCPLVGFPCSFLHQLRRIAALVRAGQPVTPLDDVDDWIATDDPVLKAEYRRRGDSHLIHHSDADGYYVPVDFVAPLSGTWFRPLPSETVGSSYRLLAELRALAAVIEVPLVAGELTDESAEALADELEGDEPKPFSLEREVWFALFEAARLSVQHKTAIRFG